jgi:hypothetical protein
MKQAFILIFGILPLSSLIADEPQATTPVAAVETAFSPEAVLNEEQVNIVRQLALKSGLSSLGKITTYNSNPPGSSYSIIATDVEEVIGREVRWKNVTIRYQNEKFDPRISEVDRVIHRIGDFWISKNDPVDEARGIRLNYRGKPIRVRLLDNVQVDFAERIIGAFAAGKVQYANPEDQKTADEWREGDLTPTGITEVNGKAFRIGFATKGSNAALSFNCVISDDGIVRVIDLRVRIS